MEKLGLIAGSGQFPILVADEAKKQGLETIAIGFNKITSPDLVPHVNKLCWIDIGNFSKLIKEFKSEKINKAIMVGHVGHVNIFREIRLDLRTLRLLKNMVNKKLTKEITNALIQLRREKLPLTYGDFKVLHMDTYTLVYMRSYFDKTAIIVFNKSKKPLPVLIKIPARFKDGNFKSNFDAEFDFHDIDMKIFIEGNSFDIITN